MIKELTYQLQLVDSSDLMRDRAGDRVLDADAESPAHFYVLTLSRDDARVEFGLVSEGHGSEPSIFPLDNERVAVALDSTLYLISLGGDVTNALRSDYIIFELHVVGPLLIVYTEAAIYAVSIGQHEVVWRDYANDIITDFVIESHEIVYRTVEGDSVTLKLADGARVAG